MRKKHFLSLSVMLFLPGIFRAKAQNTSFTANKTVTVYTTAQNTAYRLAKTATLNFAPKPQPVETEISVFVDPAKTFQSVVGFGGALTDASAETFYKLPKNKQQELLQAYFNADKGIGYTMGRTNIQSCDFSSGSYSYVNEGDAGLKSFSVKHDEQYRIPFIKQVMAAAGGKINLFVTPWSPPAFMKTNHDVLHGGHLLPQYRQAWANFFVKFISTYQKMGIPIWGLSIQNEEMATQTWESCVYTADEERAFIKVLGPTLQKAGYADKKLMAWDHNRDLVYQRASAVLEDLAAAKYVWGIAYHWYETWTGGEPQFVNVRRVHEAFPKTNLMFTEGCGEKFDYSKINDWGLGERYGNDMVNDFNAGTTGWTDWNILLDEKGGPNHVGNYCYSPVIADTKTGELHYTNSFYYLGHFSKFVRPGARRIAASSSRSSLQTTAFINTDGKIAVIVLNLSDQKIAYNLSVSGNAVETSSLPHSISTLIIQ
ncbi:glycoside hydrolase family 30 protein [Mucilaginibacter sp.]|uniref:glycoside hydrolase family 30 protein n=1 Tax=Mucilaginibacter sp. TaxID=1882438 RepID=UPI003B00BEC4